MCGIVCYFGGAGNNFTRLLTAMSAIIYRAPDSTGIGLFGDDQEPVRLRKALGSVSNLSSGLLRAAVYPNQSAKLMRLWTLPDQQISLEKYQKRILEFQEHSEETYSPLLSGKNKPLSIDDLTAAGPAQRYLRPGTPGRATPLPLYFITSPEQFSTLLRTLASEYDISTVVLRSLIQKNLEWYIQEEEKTGQEITAEKQGEILNTFDRIFDEVISRDTVFQESLHTEYPQDSNPFKQDPEIRELAWYYLKKMPFQIPEDYDRDGVRCTFRILDAALMCRLRMFPELHTGLQEVLESLWPAARYLPNTDWQTMYQAEKGANVYGWGAASVLTYLQKNEIFPLLWQTETEPVPAFRGGHTDSVCLRFLSEPVIAHGRWALQSAVNVNNSHPFHDFRRHRCIVLNGQFSSQVESETHDFLASVAGMPFRTENSSEYFALLWGYYFHNLLSEKKRYDEIRIQADRGSDVFYMGSHSIDFRVYRQLEGKSAEALDEMAFLEAVRRMKSDGGQVAAAGISLHSPRRVYIACHNRPAFVVQRADNNDIMIVSDINAALGLFSQSRIRNCADRLQKLIKRHYRELQKYRDFGASEKETARMLRAQRQAENSLLEPFRITVFPLEGEEIFVRLETCFQEGTLDRRALISDFNGHPLPDIEAFSTVLNPLQMRKGLYGSFYEKHLNEIPDRLHDILRYYIPEGEKLPRFDLREKLRERRFGPGLHNLKRIVLAGMGSSYHTGLIARAAFVHLLPELDIRVVQPAETDHVRQLVFPEKDLLLLLSWSSTTADMVEFAKELRDANTVMIGITEKVFADMALICGKSGGVIPVLSGEEVTVSGIKSTMCMLFCLHLFALRLGEYMKSPFIWDYAEKIKEIPRLLADLLHSSDLKDFAEDLARKNARSHACILIGDRDTGREGALKLEECSWSSIGRTLDYGDILSGTFPVKKLAKDPQGHLLLVDAYCSSRIDEALQIMEMLYQADVCFTVIGTRHSPRTTDIRKYSRDSAYFMPDADPSARPFLLLLFYYIFTLEFARARGRKDDEFPRNRAKSVTAGRSRSPVRLSAGGELMALARRNSAFRTLGNQSGEGEESLWEQQALSHAERKSYRQIRILGEYLSADAPLQYFFPGQGKKPGKDIAALGKMIFEELNEGGELVFAAFDREAEAAAHHIRCQWQRFTDCPVYVCGPEEEEFSFHENTLLFCLGTRSPVFSDKKLEKLHRRACLWLGPALPADTARIFRSSLGYFPGNAADSIALYADICILLTEARKSHSLQRGEVIAAHFRYSGHCIRTLLSDGELRRHIRRIMRANRKYHTAFYIGPPAGSGLSWVQRFDRIQGPDTAWHSFGTCAHGPLATVDNNVKAKYIRLQGRKKMIAEYGEKRVMRWERYYLGGLTADQFLQGKRPVADPLHPGPKAFFAEGDWYIPALHPDYDTVEDNLIILDATRSHYFSQALDELSTLGCRNARIILITQKAFVRMPDKKALFTHPFSHLIRIPSPKDKEEALPVSGFILPFLMEIIGIALAAEAGGERE